MSHTKPKITVNLMSHTKSKITDPKISLGSPTRRRTIWGRLSHMRLIIAHKQPKHTILL